MKQTMWAEAILESYSNLVILAEAIDTKIKNLTTIQYVENLSAFDLSDKVIDLIEKKILMCNTKVLVERIFNQLDVDDAKILMLTFVDKMNREKVAKHMNINTRTYYRRISKAKSAFVKYLTLNGYDEEKLNNIYKNQYWLLKYVPNIKLEKSNKNISNHIGQMMVSG